MAASNIHKLFFTFDLYRGMQENRLEYIYRGPFTDKVVESLMLLAESNLREDPLDLATKKKLYFLMVESLQNITRHQHEQSADASERSGIFIVRKSQNRYLLTTGNLIHGAEIEKLRKLIDTVNNLSLDDLKAQYRQVLDTGEISAKGGAGLGLIGMARKSGNKLDYHFRQLDDTHWYFYLNIALDEVLGMETEESIASWNQYFDNIALIHDILNREKILLNYCGSFSEATYQNLKEIISTQIADLVVRERVLMVVRELITNIVRHGRDIEGGTEKKSGILIFSKTDERYHIATGNYLNNEMIPYFEEQMELSRTLFHTTHYANAQALSDDLGSDSLMRIQLASQNSINWEVNFFSPHYSFVTVEAIVE